MMTKDEMKAKAHKSVETSTGILKFLAMVGNSVYTGGMYALCTAAPIVGIPLKICAAISGYFIAGWMTDKSDSMIDFAANEAIKVLDEAIDKVE